MNDYVYSLLRNSNEFYIFINVNNENRVISPLYYLFDASHQYSNAFIYRNIKLLRRHICMLALALFQCRRSVFR